MIFLTNGRDYAIQIMQFVVFDNGSWVSIGDLDRNWTPVREHSWRAARHPGHFGKLISQDRGGNVGFAIPPDNPRIKFLLSDRPVGWYDFPKDRAGPVFWDGELFLKEPESNYVVLVPDFRKVVPVSEGL